MTSQFFRAIIGTITIFILFLMGSLLFYYQTGFLKYLGIFDVVLIYFISLHINYKFIQQHDKELEEEKNAKSKPSGRSEK